MSKTFREEWREDSLRQKIGLVVCIGGASCCIAVGLLGIVMILYWHHVTGDWLDDHIFFWQPIGLGSVAGIFVFTRIIAPIFDLR
jgi:hypothetical protein